MISGLLEAAAAVYELTTVVTDVILNHEYIQRDWLEEYILSIVFLVFNGFVMALVGLGVERMHPNRYSRIGPLNKLVAFFLGFFQMRVFTETMYSVHAHNVKESHEKLALGPPSNYPGSNPAGPTSTTNGDARTQTVGGHTAAETQREEMESRAEQLSSGVQYVTFIQAVVRDVPLFVLQANATIHYRKWEFLDLFAVFSTGIMLVRGAGNFVAKEDKTSLKILGMLFMFGQFVFRLGAILLLAMTTGLSIAVYALAISIFSVIWMAHLRLAHSSPRFRDQLPRAIILFPFYTIFTLDGSQLSARFGSALPALRSPKLLMLHAWRCLENVVAIVLAIMLPRYVDFGGCTDELVAIIGCGCAAFYLVCFALFWVVAPCLADSPARRSSSLSLDAARLAAPTSEVPHYIRDA